MSLGLKKIINGGCYSLRLIFIHLCCFTVDVLKVQVRCGRLGWPFREFSTRLSIPSSQDLLSTQLSTNYWDYICTVMYEITPLVLCSTEMVGKQAGWSLWRSTVRRFCPAHTVGRCQLILYFLLPEIWSSHNRYDHCLPTFVRLVKNKGQDRVQAHNKWTVWSIRKVPQRTQSDIRNVTLSN